MRRAFASTFTELARIDSRVVYVTGDLGYQFLDEFKHESPERYINVGVCEAQMVYVAAGLALEGFRPVAYSIASFATGRTFEQIRYCLGYHHLPVVLVGAGRGFLYSNSGVSHHAADDLALMSVIPGMTVVAPADPGEIQALLPQLLAHNGPSYISVGRYGEPVLHAETAPVLGQARLVRKGERVAFLSTGEIAHEVFKAVDLLSSEGINCSHYQFHTVKPIDINALERIVAADSSIIIVEEHVPVGGLWSAVCNWLVSQGISARIVRVGAPDEFMLGNKKQNELRKALGLDFENLADVARKEWHDS